MFEWSDVGLRLPRVVEKSTGLCIFIEHIHLIDVYQHPTLYQTLCCCCLLEFTVSYRDTCVWLNDSPSKLGVHTALSL